MAIRECISCKRNLANDRGSVIFPCPKCGEYEITRCKKCRMIVARYTCPSCGFTGPN
ncbi:MAG: zinc finger domain-containing protein [Nanoarchaeota archaeon]